MHYSVKRKLYIPITMDSSEAIIFNQGGMHQIVLSRHEAWEEDDNNDNSIIDSLKQDWDEIVITIQMPDASRFNFIKNEADKHKQRQK